MSKFRLEINRIFLPFIAVGSFSSFLVGTEREKNPTGFKIETG